MRVTCAGSWCCWLLSRPMCCWLGTTNWASLVCRWPAAWGVPLVLEVNAPAEESRRYYDEYFHLGWLQEWCSRFKMRRAGAIVVVSRALADYLVERYDVDPERVVVASNGADVERFRPDTPSELPRSDEQPRVGFVGSFQSFHGLDLLAGMVEAVAAARPQARFLFVGGGDGAEDLSRRLDLGERATFTGRVPHGRVPGLVASSRRRCHR